MCYRGVSCPLVLWFYCQSVRVSAAGGLDCPPSHCGGAERRKTANQHHSHNKNQTIDFLPRSTAFCWKTELTHGYDAVGGAQREWKRAGLQVGYCNLQDDPRRGRETELDASHATTSGNPGSKQIKRAERHHGSVELPMWSQENGVEEEGTVARWRWGRG